MEFISVYCMGLFSTSGFDPEPEVERFPIFLYMFHGKNISAGEKERKSIHIYYERWEWTEYTLKILYESVHGFWRKSSISSFSVTHKINHISVLTRKPKIVPVIFQFLKPFSYLPDRQAALIEVHRVCLQALTQLFICSNIIMPKNVGSIFFKQRTLWKKIFRTILHSVLDYTQLELKPIKIVGKQSGFFVLDEPWNQDVSISKYYLKS